MSFIGILKSEKVQTVSEQVISEAKIDEAKEKKKPEDVLRGAGFKIRLVTPTSFGTQIDFAKSYDPNAIKDVLSGFSIKIKGKSVFIVD